MIGTGSLASLVGAVLVVLALLGGGAADPSALREADRLVGERASEALEALDGLTTALEPALEGARDGSSLVVQGDDPPGPRLVAAAVALEGAADEADAAHAAIAAFDRARHARGPGAQPARPAVEGAELEAIAVDLRAAAPTAGAVARLRHGAAEVLGRIDEALAALVDRSYGEARAAAIAARAGHDAILQAELPSDALPVWLGATDAMISAVTTLIDATETGDREAAAAAAADFAAVAEDAATADRALRVAIAEGADAATRAVVARLGAAISSLGDARAEIAAEAPPR